MISWTICIQRLLELAHGKVMRRVWHHGVVLHSVIYKLIERNPPPLGGFLCTMFPHQEPCVRGPHSKDLYQVLRGGTLTHGSWWGNKVNRKPPCVGGFRSKFKRLERWRQVWLWRKISQDLAEAAHAQERGLAILWEGFVDTCCMCCVRETSNRDRKRTHGAFACTDTQ